MIEKTHFFLQLKRVVLKIVFFKNIFSLDSFDVVEKFLAVSEHLSGIVEIHANHIVAQGIANSIL